MKTTPPAQIIQALTEVINRAAPMSPEVARCVVSLFRKFAPPEIADYKLTESEKQILKMLVAGHHYKTAAHELSISIHTVSFHLRNYLRQAPRPFKNRSCCQSSARRFGLKYKDLITF